MFILNNLVGFGGGGLPYGDEFRSTKINGNGAAQTIITGQNLLAGSLILGKNVELGGDWTCRDTVRGATKRLIPNAANSQITDGTGYLTSFNVNGMTYGSLADENSSGVECRAFSWREQERFCDVVTWIGNGSSNRQIPHGLKTTPQLIKVKCLDDPSDWAIGHEDATWSKWGQQNSTAAFGSATSEWNNTAPTSTVFTVGNSSDVNATGKTYVAYLFAERSGLSRFGSYIGTGASNAITGFDFSPSYMEIKCIDAVGDWWAPYLDNITVYMLKLNSSDARSAALLTFDASGFTLGSSSFVNALGKTYIYSAWR